MQNNENLGTIKLSSDPDHVAKLRRKLDEYEERWAYQAPEVRDTEGNYRIIILRELLEKGRVEVAELRVRVFSRPRLYEVHHCDRARFRGAAQIVAAYNSGDTRSLVRGTGLR